mgnify:CR=1 FL=1
MFGGLYICFTYRARIKEYVHKSAVVVERLSILMLAMGIFENNSVLQIIVSMMRPVMVPVSTVHIPIIGTNDKSNARTENSIEIGISGGTNTFEIGAMSERL